ncbi:AbrB family transcriptional regulator, partial [Clostridium sp. 2-1]
MKSSGIVRNLDNLGRVVIPKEIRKVLGINEGDPIEIAKVNNDIVLRKYSKGCIFCGSD